MIATNSFINVDGGVRLEPRDAPDGTVPMAVSASNARQAVTSFLSLGHTAHSQCGATVWVILAYCREQGIPVTAERVEGGYWITRRGADES